MMLSSAVCQIVLGGTLGLGLGPIPQFGMRGVAAGSLIAYIDQHLRDVLVSVLGPRRASFPRSAAFAFAWAMFIDILKVGAISCFSPLQSVLTISIFTHMLASFGTEILAGYGIGARLEFMLTSIAFAVGIASVPMVGMAIGAERIARARRICLDRGAASHSSRSAWSASFIADIPRHLGRHLSPTTRACAPPAGSICRRRRRCTPSSALRRRCIFRRRARPR